MKLLAPTGILLLSSGADFAIGTGIRGQAPEMEVVRHLSDGVVDGGSVFRPRSGSSRAATRVIDYPKDGVELGQGWDSLHAGKKQTVGLLFEAGKAAQGQIKNMKISQTEDRSSLMSAMSVSVDMQYRGMVSEASAKFDFASNVKVDSQSQTFVARATVENGRDYAAPVSQSDDGQSILLTETAVDLASENIQEFHRIYGDSFVSAIHTGAELVTSMAFDVQEREESRSISAAVSGSGWGFEASAEVSSALDTYSESSKLTLGYYQAGGSGDVIPTDVAGFRSKIGELAALARDAPHPYAVTLQRFDSLPNWPRASLPMRGSNQEQITSLYFEYRTLFDEIEVIEDHPDEYVLGRGVDLEDLRATKDVLKEKLAGLEGIFFDFDDGTIDELPSYKSFTPGYELRTRLPLPKLYVNGLDSRFSDGDELSELVSEYWIRNIVDSRCERLGFSDATCLSNGEIEKYASRVPRNHPNVVGALTRASTKNGASTWVDQTLWGRRTSVGTGTIATQRAWSKTYGEGQQKMEFFIDYSNHRGLIRGIRQYASSKNSAKPWRMQYEWGSPDGFEEVTVADYRCWSTFYTEGHCRLKFYLDLDAVYDDLKGFVMETSTLNGAAKKTTKRQWGEQAGERKELMAHFRSWDDRHGGDCQGYLSVISTRTTAPPSPQPSPPPSPRPSPRPSTQPTHVAKKGGTADSEARQAAATIRETEIKEPSPSDEGGGKVNKISTPATQDGERDEADPSSAASPGCKFFVVAALLLITWF